MSTKNLELYLNDHLAGSVGARELLSHLVKTFREESLGSFFQDLDREIEAKQAILRDLMGRIGVPESSVRQTAAWVAEKISRFKLGLGVSESDPMGLFESLEGLVLGTFGQHSLWAALGKAAPQIPSWAEVDFERLGREARALSDRVEERRLELARQVLVADSKIAAQS